MKRLTLAALAAMATLAACGEPGGFSGEAKAAYELCLSGGGEAGYCSCVTRALQASMPPEDFSRMAGGGGDELEPTLDAIAAADTSCVKTPAS